MTLDPRSASYSAKDLGRRIRWIEDRLKYLASSRGLIERGSVGGGTVTIQEFFTNPAQVFGFWNTDTQGITAAGDITMYLTHVPLDGSLHVYWNGLHVSVPNWTLDSNILTITDPGWRAGDLIKTAYAYDPTVAATAPTPEPPPPGGTAIVPFSATGWKFIQLAHSDATDYSSPTFDDSAWTTTQAPFGETNPADDTSVFPGVTWPDYNTVWNQETRMWARRTVAATAGTDVELSTRVNYSFDLYWNGVRVYGTSSSEGSYTIPGASVLASNSLAIKATDNFVHGPGTGAYFDVEVRQ